MKNNIGLLIVVIFTLFIISGCIKNYATKDELNNLSTKVENVDSKVKHIIDIEKNHLSEVKEIIDSTVFIITPKGGGTGLIMDDKGYVTTATHVVTDINPKDIKVYSFNDNLGPNEMYPVDKVQKFPGIYDLSILKINSSKSFKVQKISKKEDVKYGSEALFVGFQQPEDQFFIKLIGNGVISGFYPINNVGSIERLYTIKGVSLPGGSGGPVFLKSGEGIIGFTTNVLQTPKLPTPAGKLDSQLWLVNVVPIHELNEKFEDFKKNMSVS